MILAEKLYSSVTAVTVGDEVLPAKAKPFVLFPEPAKLNLAVAKAGFDDQVDLILGSRGGGIT